MEIFKLFGSIFVDSDAADKSIKKTGENAEGFAAKLGNGIKTAAKWGAALVAAAGVGATALFGLAANAASTTDNIDKMSQKIGISREAYQELDFICSQSGTNVDNLKAGLKTLTNQMQSAADGSKTATSAFEELGLSWTDGTGALKDQEAMMWEAMAALQSCENQTKKSALAVDLFGKAGTELMPMLNGASGSIEAMKEQAHELGLVLSDDAVDAGVRFTDTVDQAKRSLAAVVTRIGVDVMPAVQTVLDWVMDNMPMIQEVIQAALGAVQTAVGFFSDMLQGALLAIQLALGDTGLTFGSVMSSIQDIFSLAWSVLDGAWQGIGQPLFGTIVSAAFFLLDNWSVVAEGIEGIFQTCWAACSALWDSIGRPIWDMVSFVISETASVFSGHMADILSFFQGAVAGIQDTWENHLKPVFDVIGSFLNDVLVPAFEVAFSLVIGPLVSNVFDGISRLWTGTLKPVFDGICDFLLGVFTADWDRALTGILDIVTGIFNGIQTAVETPMNFICDIVDSAIDFICDKFDFDWKLPDIKLPHFKINGEFSLAPPSVPSFGIDWYAEGGILERPTAFGINPKNGNAMVGGEAGPEAVAPIETLQQYIREAVDSQNQKVIELLAQILAAITGMDGSLLEKMLEALESFRFEVRDREFARLVREVMA